MKCEGKVAESEGGVIETPYIFHPASNALYRTITLDLNESIVLNQDETTELMLDLDIRKAFEGPSIEDNLDLSRLGTLTEKDLTRIEKYKKALKYLKAL